MQVHASATSSSRVVFSLSFPLHVVARPTQKRTDDKKAGNQKRSTNIQRIEEWLFKNSMRKMVVSSHTQAIRLYKCNTTLDSRLIHYRPNALGFSKSFERRPNSACRLKVTLFWSIGLRLRPLNPLAACCFLFLAAISYCSAVMTFMLLASLATRIR